MKGHNDDIISDVSEKTGYPYDTVKEVYDTYFKRMRECIESKDYFPDFKPEDCERDGVKFPMWDLGYLYISIGRIIKMNKRKVWKLTSTD